MSADPTMSLNPYQPPKTVVELSTAKKEQKPPKAVAYRIGDLFYCEPHFETPRICFKTGVPIAPEAEKSILRCRYYDLHFYFDQSYLKSLGRRQLLKSFGIITFSLLSVAVSIVTSSFPVLIPAILLFIYVLRPVKERSIKVDPIENGFFVIHGGHPDFLKCFPDSPPEGINKSSAQ